jgi:dTDP-glucose pyrophosphorylase
MYWKCMSALKALPSDTVIIEDSHIGREGALNSKAHLVPVTDPEDLLKSNAISDAIEHLITPKNENKRIPWRDSKMNVLIPMAGAGSRFEKAGYTFPKPLIEVNGKPMIQVVADNLNVESHFIFIVRKEHYDKYNLKYLLGLIQPGCDIIQVDAVTEGAACTTLLAESLIDNENPLLIANSDQFLEWNSNSVLYAFSADEIDAGIVTFKATHPKWSFARLDDNGFVVEVAEKKPISDNATVGVYYWKKGSDYVKYAKQMIEKDIRTNGEFYVAPVFNEAILDGKKIRAKEIEKLWGLGTPEDLNIYLEHHN